MQVVDKLDEGLNRVFGVKVDATELGALLEARIAEITPTLNLKGFRPGKVPQAHVRRLYGKALMGEVVEKTLTETSQKILEDNKLRIAAQPDVTPQSDMEQVLQGKEDLAYDLAVEIIPEFEPMDVSTLELTRLVYSPSDEEVDEALVELATQNRTYAPRSGKTAKAQAGDQVLVDFVGRVDGKVFEGGAATDAEVVLGSGQLIPGFEDQLIGASPGAQVSVAVTFPEDYSVEALRAKPATFEVTVKEVRAPKAAAVDDALAERLGMTDLAALKDALRANLQREYDSTSRFKLKRSLLDALDKEHAIALPRRMVESEFAGIWRQVEHDREHGHPSPEDEGKSDDILRSEYQRIAERRVRLGLVLAEIGRRAEVAISEQELGDALRAEAMRYGAQAQQVFDMLRQNPDALAQVRAPLYEEKVVDLVLERATVTDKPVGKAELLEEDDLPEGFGGHDHASEHDHAHDDAAAPAKTGRSKKTKAKGEPAEEAATAIAPAQGKSPKAAKSGTKSAATGDVGAKGAGKPKPKPEAVRSARKSSAAKAETSKG